MQLVATIAVVLSVLALAYQARELTRQSRLANHASAVRADFDVTVLSVRANDVFVRYPELRARFFDGDPTALDAVESRLLTVADQYADVLQVALDTATRLGRYGWGTSDVTAWATSMVAAFSPLRSVVRDNPGLWPPLEQFVASYDAEHVGQPAIPPPELRSG